LPKTVHCYFPFTYLIRDLNTGKYIVILNSEGFEKRDKFFVNSPLELISALKRDISTICEKLSLDEITLNTETPEDFQDFNHNIGFYPALNNYCTLNQIIANFWSGIENRDDDYLKRSVDAQNNPYDFTRLNKIVQQVIQIDSFTKLGYQKKLLSTVSLEPLLSPLILVIPFINPNIDKILPSFQEPLAKKLLKNFKKVLSVEQTNNYIHHIHNDDGELTEKFVEASLAMVGDRLDFIDKVSYLHASFSFSPILRLPIRGQSLYKDLLFFKPSVSLSRDKV